MSRTRFRLLPGTALALCLLASATTALATPGVVVRKAELRDNTSFSARVLQRVPPGSTVTLIKRRGGWQQVRLADDTVGWMRLYQVRAGQASSTTVQSSSDSSRGVLSNLAAWSRGASGMFGSSSAGTSNQTTATVGIRGLSAEDLNTAKPDQQELEQLKRYGVKAKTAHDFARVAPLKRRKVKFIDDEQAVGDDGR